MQDRTDTGRINYFFQWHDSIKNIPREQWDYLARDLDTPFLHWEWLHLLEKSGSVSPEAGWQPSHLAVYSSDRLVAAAPLYIKYHSAGEFVFDQQLAQLASRLNRPYYPKLVGMSPFTPISAYRFLLARDQDQDHFVRIIQEEIEKFCRTRDLSGYHYHFLESSWTQRLQPQGCTPWLHPGFVWENHGFQDFDDFLAGFKSNRRKNIRKERKSLARQGIRVEALRGEQIRREHLLRMYKFYVHTNRRYFPWSCKYLTRDFFLGLTREVKEHVLLLAAFSQGQAQPLGMSMLLFKDGRLFGRYWGGTENVPFLHFNLCYYEPVNWAIQNNIRIFDPGMGGEHKLSRGFKLAPNYSLHKIFDPTLQHILTTFLQESNTVLEQNMMEMNRENSLHN